MLRNFLIVFSLFCLTVSSFSLADDAEDIEQVKKVIYRYEEGVFSGDVDKIVSCFASDFVQYSPISDSLCLFLLRGDMHNIIDPENWYVAAVGLETIRQQSSQFENYPEYLTKVSHVSVMDGRAIAVSRHQRRWNDQTARETVISEFRSVWMLAKTGSEWKVTSILAHVTGGQLVSKMRPPQ